MTWDEIDAVAIDMVMRLIDLFNSNESLPSLSCSYVDQAISFVVEPLPNGVVVGDLDDGDFRERFYKELAWYFDGGAWRLNGLASSPIKVYFQYNPYVVGDLVMSICTVDVRTMLRSVIAHELGHLRRPVRRDWKLRPAVWYHRYGGELVANVNVLVMQHYFVGRDGLSYDELVRSALFCRDAERVLLSRRFRKGILKQLVKHNIVLRG